MRDIRSRISTRPGIELSSQQVQELAARRLETILDPRHVKPALLEQLRKTAGEAVVPVDADPGYSFEDTTLYETHRGVLSFIRRLLNPVLKLFFNPTPLVHALNTQARLNKEAAAREAERERRQAEWNALHYELLQRVVTEVSRIAIDTQTLSTRIESLAAKVDFNERRVRGIENAVHQGRVPQRPAPVESGPAPVARAAEAAGEVPAVGGGDAPRRRRRRRRGRRGPGSPDVAVAADGAALSNDVDEGEGDDEGAEEETSEPLATASEPSGQPTPAVAAPSALTPDASSAPEAPTAATREEAAPLAADERGTDPER